MWGRLLTCAAVGYRRRSAVNAGGTLWVGPIANRPQLTKLPHKVSSASQAAPPFSLIFAYRAGFLAFVDLVAGGGLEEVSGGLAAADVGQAEALVAGPRVAVLGHDIHLEFGGVPGFGGDLNRPVIADGAGGERGNFARAFGVDAFDHLFAERFAGVPLEHHSGGSGRHHTAAACRCGAADTTTAADPGADTNAKGLGGPVRLCLGHGFRDSFFIQRHAVEGYGGRTVPAALDGER